jgi:cysteine desulfurase/selenocysteine lyase
MEHHSNIVPWQMVCEETGAKLKVIPITDEGDLDMKNISELLNPKTKMLALTQVSNALGTVNPVADLIRLAHEKGAKVLVDGAQAVSHMAVDVRALDSDFYTFSGHKLYGPTGIGLLYGKYSLLEAMPPYQGGGDMIASVTFEKTLYKKPPHKFEAGTPAIAEVIGLGAALDYVSHIGLLTIAAHEDALLAYGTKILKRVPGLTLIGTSAHKTGVLSFTLGEIHPHDLGTILDQEGVAIRAGHHCAQPVMDRYGISATARASLALYNTTQDLDQLVTGLNKALELFG